MTPLINSLFYLTALLAGSTSALPSRLHQRATSSTSGGPIPPRQDPFYTAPQNWEQAQPGSILRLRTAPGNLTAVVGNSSAAYNIVYRTTDSRYLPSWAVTTLFVPNENTTSGESLLSYQIPYDTADVDYSPSYALYQGPPSDIGIALSKGWYVNVPDYEGPNASFTAGVQSGHATLDSVRAVLSSGFGLADNVSYAMWGYSGGALASEWAAELQVQYAPELNFSGVAIGGLTPNVTETALIVNSGFEVGLVPAGILGLSSQHPELKQLVLQELIPNSTSYNESDFLSAVNKSLTQSIEFYAGQNMLKYFMDGLGLFQNPIVRRVIATDGVMGLHGVPAIPAFVYKTINDEVSNVTLTDALVQKYCEANANILYQRNNQGTHPIESVYADAMAFTWLETVFNGTHNATYGTNGCTIQNVSVNSTYSAILSTTTYVI